MVQYNGKDTFSSNSWQENKYAYFLKMSNYFFKIKFHVTVVLVLDPTTEQKTQTLDYKMYIYGSMGKCPDATVCLVA